MPEIVTYDSAVAAQFLMMGDRVERKGRFMIVNNIPERDHSGGMVNVALVDEDTGTLVPDHIPYGVMIPLGYPLPA
jgi:hypothetical protein